MDTTQNVIVEVIAASIFVIMLATMLLRRSKKKKRNSSQQKDGEKKQGIFNIEFSKRMLYLYCSISLFLILIVIVGTLLSIDVSVIAALAGTSLVVDGTWGGFYLWKSKNENRAKYAQRFVMKFADKYGIDAAIRLAEVVLKD